MANIILNIAKGRGVEFYWRVKNNDPANSAFIVVPIETTGLETDAVLRDKDTLADFLSGATNEQTTMGRKTLTDVELAAFPSPDDTGDKMVVFSPAYEWTGAQSGGNAISKLLYCIDMDTTSGSDSNIIPISCHDYVVTPTGAPVGVPVTAFYEAA